MKKNETKGASVKETAPLLLTEDAEKKRNRWTLAVCFAVPLMLMFIIHICMRVYPFGTESILLLDMNAQYISFFEKLRDILVDGESIIYAFDRNLGGEFMGMFAYYLSSPFSLLVALFPKNMITEALLLIFLLKTGFCGLTFGYFLNKMRKMPPPYTVMLSTMYALCAYAVVMQHNIMWIDNLIALPLIVVGIEALIREGKYRLFVLSLVYAVMSNFYIGYMTCIFVFIYFFVRYFMLTPKERNPERKKNNFYRTLLRMGIFSAIALAISMVIILPTYYSLSFGKFEFTDPKYEAEQLYEFFALLTKTFFGSYDTVRAEGMPFFYCGMLMPILLPLYFFNSRIPLRKKIGFAVLLLVFLVSFNFSLADIFWHGMQKPNWLNHRYAFIFVFVALWVVAESLEHLRKLKPWMAPACAGVWAVIVLLLQLKGYENLPKTTAVLPTLICLVLYGGMLLFATGKLQKVITIVLSAVVCLEMCVNGVITLAEEDRDVVISSRNSYRNVIDKYTIAVNTIEDDTFYRAEKLVHRKKNDNMALDLNGMTSSTSTLNARTIDFLGKFGIASKAHWTMYVGGTSVFDTLFGIKYLIVDESSNKNVKEYIRNLYELQTTTEEKLGVYKNPYALSIAYEVNDDILGYDLAPVPDPMNPGKTIDEDYVEPFRYMNEVLSAMIGREITVFSKVDTEGPKPEGVKTLRVVGHEGYEVTESGKAKLTYTMNIESELPVYFYLPSEYPREVSLKVNGKSRGQYMKDDTHSILELGSFNVGDTIEVEISLKGTNLYITSDTHYFWYYDEAAFVEAAEALQKGNLAAYSDKDDEIYGKINVTDEESVIFTTIPYDSGWKVYVDGKRVETTAVLNGSVLAFDCPAGEHDIRLVYRPIAVTGGLTISILGFVAFAVIVFKDYGWRREGGKWVRVTKK